jgi:rubredoxin
MSARIQKRKRESLYWKEMYPRSWLCPDCEIKSAFEAPAKR